MIVGVALTSIGWIGVVKRSGDEWSFYTKKFTLAEKPEFATIRLNSQGVCGIFVNGNFVESSCGRYMNRITYVEITSLLQQGENEIRLELGNHYFQPNGVNIYNRRGAWVSAVAAEIEIHTGHNIHFITTDENWECTSDEEQMKTSEFFQVNEADYERFWKSAALKREPKTPVIPQAVAKVVGDEYLAYAKQPWQEWVEPVSLVETSSWKRVDETLSFLTYDFGKTQVGYIELEYESTKDAYVTLLFEYFELIEDFGEASGCQDKVEKLAICQPIRKGHHTTLVLRRRASRYVQLQLPKGVKVQKIRFRLSLLPSAEIGWFSCSEPLLNQIFAINICDSQ